MEGLARHSGHWPSSRISVILSRENRVKSGHLIILLILLHTETWMYTYTHLCTSHTQSRDRGQCLSVRFFFALKRHHEHDNSYKEKHLLETVVQFQRFIIFMARSMVACGQAGKECHTRHGLSI